MWNRSRRRPVPALWRSLPLIALLVTATAEPAKTARKPAGPRPALIEVEHQPGGFTITQKVRSAPDVQADYEAAVRLAEAGQYQTGVAALVAVTGRAPDATAGFINLGLAHARQGELDQAEASLQRALELNPDHPAARTALGLVQRRKGQFAAARASYEAVLALFPGYHVAHRNLGVLCDLYLGDSACALDHYEAYALAAPDDAEVARWIAELRGRATTGGSP